MIQLDLKLWLLVDIVNKLKWVIVMRENKLKKQIAFGRVLLYANVLYRIIDHFKMGDSCYHKHFAI